MYHAGAVGMMAGVFAGWLSIGASAPPMDEAPAPPAFAREEGDGAWQWPDGGRISLENETE